MRLFIASSLVSATFAAGPLLADFTPPINEVVTYGVGAELLQISAPTLSDIAQEAWDAEFLPSSYFSAFALSKSGGYGYATTTNSRSAAREIAMMECLAQNAQCRVIAEILPAGYVEPPANVATLTVEIAGYLEELKQEAGFKAAAVSADGAYAMVWGHANRADAERAAMTDCESYRRQPATPDAPSWPCVLLPAIK
jgi:hypothetical protein